MLMPMECVSSTTCSPIMRLQPPETAPRLRTHTSRLSGERLSVEVMGPWNAMPLLYEMNGKPPHGTKCWPSCGVYAMPSGRYGVAYWKRYVPGVELDLPGRAVAMG